MPNPLASELREFALAAEARRVDRQVLFNRLFFGALGIGLAVLAVRIVFPPYHQPLSALYVVAGTVWLLSGTFLYAAARSRGKRALDDVRLSAVGLTLHFEDGVTIQQSWGDPRFGLTLRDYTIDPLSPVDVTDHLILLAPRNRFGSIPPGVASAITTEAKAHSLPVAVRKEAVYGYKTVHFTMTTRIGRIELTPDWKGYETPAR